MAISTKRLLFSCSALALACAAPVLVSQTARWSLSASLERNGFSAQSVSVALDGTMTIEGLQRRDGHGAWRIGRISAGLGNAWLPQALAQAGAYTIENVGLTMRSAKIDIPKITVTGANFGQDDIARIFAADSGMPERIRGMSAKSVSIPEMRVTAAFPEVESITYVFRDMAADDIVNGKIARQVIGGATFATKAKKGEQRGEIRRTEIRGLDLAHGARVYYGVAGPNEPLAPLYDSYVAEGMTSSVTSDAEVAIEFGRMTSNAVRARPMQGKSLEATLAELITKAEAQRASGDKSTDPRESLPMFRSMVEMVNIIEDDGMTGENIRVTVGEKARPFATFSIAKVEGTYGNATRPSAMRFSGMEMTGPDAKGKLGEFSVEGFSYAPTFKAFADAMAAGDADLKAIDPRKLIPKLGTISLKGLEADVPDPKAPRGVKPERIQIRLGNFVTALSDQFNGIPTKINFAIDNLAVKLPAVSSDASVRQLKALGYSALDLSARIAANWNEQAKEIAITEVSLGGADMGKARISGVLGNVGREVFEGDMTMAQVALMGATAKSVNLQVDNAGLVEKAFAFQARSQNAKPDDIRRELGTAAALGIPAILGPTDDVKALAGAISKFIARPRTLKIDLKAKNAAGVGLPDIVTVGDPQKALTLVNVTASSGD